MDMFTSMKKVFVHSNGCVPNKLEGKKISDLFADIGWTIINQPETADIIVMNFCGYSGNKIDESRKIADNLNTIRRKDSELILTGCMDRISPDFKNAFPFGRIIEFSEFSRVFGIPDPLDNLFVSDNLVDVLETTKKDIFNIVTSKGCLGTCSYCAIRRARGKLKSKTIDQIINDFYRGIDLGYKKFILWADDLGAYGHDISSSYIELLGRLIEARIKTDYQLYLHRLNPQWIVSRYSELKELLKSNKIRLLYTPIESGSPRVLNLMQRPYRIEKVICCLKEIKAQFQDIKLKTDIMIGFPSETNEDFEQTLHAIQEIKFDELVVFNYSGVSDTPADQMKDQIPEHEKEQRQKRLWDMYPFLRFILDWENDRYWIFDKKDCLKVPAYTSVY